MSIYKNVKLRFNFIFIIHVTSSNFETQIIYMWSLKLFKVNEILHVTTLDIMCSSKFASNCVHHSLPTPNTLHESSIAPKFLDLNPSTVTIHDFLSCSSWLFCSHWLMNLIKMTYLIIYQIEHLVKLNKKLTTLVKMVKGFSQMGHLIKLDKTKWHAYQNGQSFSNQIGHYMVVNRPN